MAREISIDFQRPGLWNRDPDPLGSSDAEFFVTVQNNQIRVNYVKRVELDLRMSKTARKVNLSLKIGNDLELLHFSKRILNVLNVHDIVRI